MSVKYLCTMRNKLNYRKRERSRVDLDQIGRWKELITAHHNLLLECVQETNLQKERV